MCGDIRHQKRSSKIGDLVVTTSPALQKTKDCIWSGFITIEKAKWWKEQSAGVDVYVSADIFVKGKYIFKIPGNRMIGIYLTKNVKLNNKIIGKAGTVKVITRTAMNTFESKIHNRWPLVRIFQIYEFGKQDITGEKRDTNQMSLLPKDMDH